MATEEVKIPETTPSGRTVHPPREHQDVWNKFGKYAVYGLAALVLIVGGYFAYNHFVKAPKEAKAAEAIWRAEELYRMDSANLALNGDGTTLGFLKIIDRYSGTDAATLSKFYAGSCYMKLGDFPNAVKYLSDFKSDDELLNIRATGLLGDAYAEQGKNAEAADQYKKAGTLYENDIFNSPEYLFRAGLLYQDLNKNKEAVDMFKRIKEKYPTSQYGRDIDKYLGRLGSYE